MVVWAFGTEEDGIRSLEKSVNGSEIIGINNDDKGSGGLDALGLAFAC